MPDIANITNIVAPRVPFVDPQTGLISREWYRFLLNLFTLTGQGASLASLQDLQIGPDGGSLTDAEIAEINKKVFELNFAVPNAAEALSQIFELGKQVEALGLTPPVVVPANNPRYGVFYDTTTQAAAAINTAYPVTFDTTSLSRGIYVGAPTSRIYVDRPGIYNFQFSLQLDNAVNAVGNFYLWARLNGVDVPYSGSWMAIRDKTAQVVAAWNFVYELNADDYFELVWSTSTTDITILASPAVAPVPAIPSVILTVTDNISA